MLELTSLSRLFTGYTPDKAQDIEFQCKTIALIAYVAAPTAAVFSIINFVAGYYELALLEISAILLLIPCFMVVSHTSWLPFVRNLLMTNACILFMALFLYGGEGASGITWSLMIPFIAFLLTGLPAGWYWSLSYAVVMSALIFAHFSGFVSLPYDETFLIFFPATFIFFAFIAAVLEVQLERIHERHQSLLLNLEDLVDVKTKEFQEVRDKLFAEMNEHNKTIGNLKAAEAQFLHAQRMESLGTLVAGLAHDFNNMLVGISGNIYLAKKNSGNKVEVRERLENVENLSAGAADMVKQLLTFARKDPMEMNVFSLTSFCKEILKLAQIAIPENISFTYNISSKELFIKGDITQLQQLIMNLLNNARDAVVDVSAPKIYFQLEPFTADNAFNEKYPEYENKDFVRLSVSDNGCGIPEEERKAVFEPFYTTKSAGKGTGLGLPMVSGSVVNHMGKIEVESEEGKGTTFIIYLPIYEGPTGGTQIFL